MQASDERKKVFEEIQSKNIYQTAILLTPKIPKDF